MSYTITPKRIAFLFCFLAIQYFNKTYSSSNNNVSNFVYSDCSETAFAFLNSDDNPNLPDEESSCFIPQFNRWGWTTLLDFSNDTGQSSYNLDFYAGAGQCDLSKGTDVGNISITYNDDGTLTVDYNMNDGFLLSEAHIYIGTNMFPLGNNGSETVAPGQYSFVDSNLGNVQNYSTSLPVEGYEFYVIVHGVTNALDCGNISCPDNDADGVCDTDDVCPGFDDTLDSDGDGIPDGCDTGGGVFRTTKFNLYPIPFKNEVNVQYSFEYDTKISIEIINSQGVTLAEIRNKDYRSGTEDYVRLNLASSSDQLLFVRLTTAKNQFTKKIITKN